MLRYTYFASLVQIDWHNFYHHQNNDRIAFS